MSDASGPLPARALVPIPVLLYHSVADVEATKEHAFTVSRAQFAEHVAVIRSSGCEPLTISELATCLRGEREMPSRPVAVTFDDGYADTTDAVRLLGDNGISSTVYVTTNRLGLRVGVDADALRDMVAGGAEIGAHTVTHPHLDEIPIDVAALEISESKRVLEEWLEGTVSSFAYPHGAHDRRVRQAVIAAGFTSAAAVKNAFSHADDDPFAIARWTVMADTASESVAAFLRGVGAPVAWDGERLRTRAFRVARKTARVVRRDAAAAPVEVPGQDLVAPVAVRVVDLDDPRSIDLARDEAAYRSALLIGLREGRPVGARVIAIERSDQVSALTLTELFEGVDETGVTSTAPRATPHELPTLSVVVTTCNQAESVCDTIASVLACDPRALEVIVVENRPVGSTVAATLKERFPGEPRLRYVDESRAGLSAARNAGLRAASGDIVAFTDDDVLVHSRWIGAFAEAFVAEPGAGCVTGLILPQDLETHSQVLIEQFAGFGKGWERRVHRLDAPTSSLFPFAAGEFGSGACTALRRDVALELGGFELSLGAGTTARGGEDLDVFVRVLLAGHHIVYEPAAMLWHRHPDHERHVHRELYSYGIGLSAMVTKQMLNGQALAVLRRVPEALRFLNDPTSRKNVRKGADYPGYFDWLERFGMLVGPFAYLTSRREQGHLDRAAQRHLVPPGVAWVGAVDVGQPLVDIRAQDHDGASAYQAARLLVRDGPRPVGLITVPLEGGYASAATIATEIGRQIGFATPGPSQPAAAPALTVSIVVCTHDREASLRRVLGSILAAEDESITEVIVVDNAPSDMSTRDAVAALGDPRLHYVLEPVVGLSRARNRGLACATGDVVAFTDDDVAVDRGWITALLGGFARSPRVACVTGLVLAAELDTPAQAYFEARVGWSSGLEPRIFDLAEHRGDRALFPYAAGELGAGANFAVRRSALDEIGGFDEALGAGSAAQGGEDLDFFARVILCGWSLAYEPSALVWHTHRRDIAELRPQMYAYGSGLGAYAFKHLWRGRAALRAVGALRHIGRSWPGRGRAAAVGRRDPGLTLLEARGLAVGPLRYVRGRREVSRRAPIAEQPPPGGEVAD